MLYFDPGTLIIPMGNGLVRLFQVFSRRNVLAEQSICSFINRCVGGCERKAFEDFYEAAPEKPKAVDATTFTLWDHAFSNSDFFDRTVSVDNLEALSFDNLLDLLMECGILCLQWPPAWPVKESFGDRFKGSFHEQIATECLFHRTKPAEWWLKQKFEGGLSAIRPTPYRFIEEAFLTQYFAEALTEKDVLDVGCGTGYFTHTMAEYAKTVIGIDYNSEYIDVAKKKWVLEGPGNLSFEVVDIFDLSQARELLKPEQFDIVFLIDIFLFLFDRTYAPDLFDNRSVVMRNISSLLKTDGVMAILDPHPLWLTPWLGSADMPFGILTEYRDRKFKVTPTLEELTSFLYECNMRIRRILEPPIQEQAKTVDSLGHAFMSQIPQWWFVEVEKAL